MRTPKPWVFFTADSEVIVHHSCPAKSAESPFSSVDRGDGESEVIYFISQPAWVQQTLCSCTWRISSGPDWQGGCRCPRLSWMTWRFPSWSRKSTGCTPGEPGWGSRTKAGSPIRMEEMLPYRNGTDSRPFPNCRALMENCLVATVAPTPMAPNTKLSVLQSSEASTYTISW